MLLSSAPLNSVGWRSWHPIISTAASQQLPITSSQCTFGGTLEHLYTFLHLYHYHLVTGVILKLFKNWSIQEKIFYSPPSAISSFMTSSMSNNYNPLQLLCSLSSLRTTLFKVMIFVFPFLGYVTLVSTANLCITKPDLSPSTLLLPVIINNLLSLSYLHSFLPSPLSSL